MISPMFFEFEIASLIVTIQRARLNSMSLELAKGEVKSLHAGIEKLDLEKAIVDWFGLADELIHSLFDDRSVALSVDINSMGTDWGLSIEMHTKVPRSARRSQPHHEIEIARVKAVGDPTVGLIAGDGFFSYGPVACERPVIDAQLRG
jgi:hypothetical protein